MHATHCLIGCMIGCVLCIASASAADTTSVEAQDVGSSARTAIGNDGPHDGSLGASSDNSASLSSSSDLHASSTDPTVAAPGPSDLGNVPVAPAHQSHTQHLGWQSLLPGSIQ